MQNGNSVLVWFRRDLRLADNPALRNALGTGSAVIPVFIHDDEGEGDWPDGGASRWWLHHSLKSLSTSLERLGSRLVVREGRSIAILTELCRKHNVTEVYWNRRYEPTIVRRDTEIKKLLSTEGVLARSFNGSLLQSPLKVRNKSGQPFRVFTPFWKHIRNLPVSESFQIDSKIPPPKKWPESLSIESLKLLPKVNWDSGFSEHWAPGENGALAKLATFSEKWVSKYDENRNLPAIGGVSRLSAHLHFGEISPSQIWHALRLQDDEAYLRQLGWREFSAHLLYHFPDTTRDPLRPEFQKFPWQEENFHLERWQKGSTGYPIVDAGMRELWHTGWMHNRVRMIAGSFLVKHLLVNWQRGAEWFWDTLVDADLANNTMGWQWVAGSGADASPYFRIFNPISQGERFDADGDYTRKWIPELSRLPDKYLFQPWSAPPSVLESCGVELGVDYPNPIVDHGEARALALAAYQKMKDAN